MRNEYHHTKIRLGFTNTYLVWGENGYLLIDAGPLNKASLFFQRLEKHRISPDQIKLIVLTHSHWDHVGSLFDIKAVCKCPVLAHEKEAFYLKNPVFKQPLRKKNADEKKQRLFGENLKRLEKKYRFKAVEAEIKIHDTLDLEDLGFSARVLPTPGHTSGSLSVVTGDAEAFVGDLAINTFPFGPGPAFPQYAYDHGQLEGSWEKILFSGAQTILPAHGRPFKVDGQLTSTAGNLLQGVFTKRR